MSLPQLLQQAKTLFADQLSGKSEESMLSFTPVATRKKSQAFELTFAPSRFLSVNNLEASALGFNHSSLGSGSLAASVPEVEVGVILGGGQTRLGHGQNLKDEEKQVTTS